jgi:glutamate/tyrosine decarboxylase-like PLP-dependent enzyme
VHGWTDETERLAQDVVAYTRERLRAYPPPLGASRKPQQLEELTGATITPDGLGAHETFRLFREALAPVNVAVDHPRFLAFIPGAPTELATLFDLAVSASSIYGGTWLEASGAVFAENQALRWIADLAGFPDTAGGCFVSGGTAGNLSALVAARHTAHERRGGRPARWAVAASSEAHSSIAAAARVIDADVCTADVDEGFRMTGETLRAALEARGADDVFAVVASAGTTNLGVVDDLTGVAEVCGERGLWLHVDGAYGAVGAADPALAPRYAGLERADSLALDPHKWLSVPVECGCALVRDGRLLRDTWSLVPPYLRTEEGKGFGGLPWYSEYGFQQTRGFRALKLWMILQHLGRDGVAALIDRHVGLARRLAAIVDAAPDLERVAPTELSVVCFRFAPPDRTEDAARLDALNKRLVERIQAEGRTFLTGTVLRGRFAMRACVLHYGTTDADVDALIDIVRETGMRLTHDF